MVLVTATYCCSCGTNTDCGWEELNIGRIFQCPQCKLTMGAILSRSGRKEWVKIDQTDIDFLDLLKEPDDDEDLGHEVDDEQILDSKRAKVDPDFAAYPEGERTPHDELFGGDPECNHWTIQAPGGGIKCTKCPGWFCH